MKLNKYKRSNLQMQKIKENYGLSISQENESFFKNYDYCYIKDIIELFWNYSITTKVKEVEIKEMLIYNNMKENGITDTHIVVAHELLKSFKLFMIEILDDFELIIVNEYKHLTNWEDTFEQKLDIIKFRELIFKQKDLKMNFSSEELDLIINLRTKLRSNDYFIDVCSYPWDKIDQTVKKVTDYKYIYLATIRNRIETLKNVYGIYMIDQCIEVFKCYDQINGLLKDTIVL